MASKTIHLDHGLKSGSQVQVNMANHQITLLDYTDNQRVIIATKWWPRLIDQLLDIPVEADSQCDCSYSFFQADIGGQRWIRQRGTKTAIILQGEACRDLAQELSDFMLEVHIEGRESHYESGCNGISEVVIKFGNMTAEITDHDDTLYVLDVELAKALDFIREAEVETSHFGCGHDFHFDDDGVLRIETDDQSAFGSVYIAADDVQQFADDIELFFADTITSLETERARQQDLTTRRNELLAIGRESFPMGLSGSTLAEMFQIPEPRLTGSYVPVQDAPVDDKKDASIFAMYTLGGGLVEVPKEVVEKFAQQGNQSAIDSLDRFDNDSPIRGMDELTSEMDRYTEQALAEKKAKAQMIVAIGSVAGAIAQLPPDVCTALTINELGKHGLTIEDAGDPSECAALTLDICDMVQKGRVPGLEGLPGVGGETTYGRPELVDMKLDSLSDPFLGAGPGVLMVSAKPTEKELQELAELFRKSEGGHLVPLDTGSPIMGGGSLSLGPIPATREGDVVKYAPEYTHLTAESSDLPIPPTHLRFRPEDWVKVEDTSTGEVENVRLDEIIPSPFAPVVERPDGPAMFDTIPADLGNPKDSIGRTKSPLSMLPEVALVHGSLGMYEGALKYGHRNFRYAPVNASVYVDALLRHLLKWNSGEEADAETTVKHLGSVIACAAILLDAQAHGTLVDDREPSHRISGLIDESKSIVARLQQLHGTDTRLLDERQ